MEAIRKQPHSQSESSSTLKDAQRLSFRDPAGTVFVCKDTIIRKVKPECSNQLQAALQLKTVSDWTRTGKLISTERISAEEFHHPRVFFPSYPYEWCPEMHWAAAEMTLQLFTEVLTEGYGLKDASARNILFNGTTPLFIDLLSIEKRHPNDATWFPFEQFLRNFIYPLALVRSKRSSLRSYFLSSMDGKRPSEVAQHMGWKAFLPRYFALVGIPSLLSQWVNSKPRANRKSIQRFTSSPAEAQFVLKILIRHLRTGLDRLKPKLPKNSRWSGYDASFCPYPAEALAQKEKFVAETLERLSPQTVLDLGCNEGKFSILAAKRGAKVVSIDSDQLCVSKLWESSSNEKLDILPLCMELNEPSPGLGWRNGETLPFLERAKDHFEMTLSLALFHHLIIQSLPLDEVMSFISLTTHRYALIEYIGPEDGQVRTGLLQRGNSIKYPSKEDFLRAAWPLFETVTRFPLPGMDRELFVFAKRKS